MAQVTRAMLFAAGRGTRMRALTRDRPKPLIAVAGKTLLDHALDLLADAGIRTVVVNTHYLGSQISDHVSTRSNPHIDLSPERDLLETGGGLKTARGLLGDDPVVTLNADAVWSGPNPVAALLADGAPVPGGARLLLVPRARAVGHTGAGDFDFDSNGALKRRAQAGTAPFVYTGVQLVDPRPVYSHPECRFSLNAIWDKMIASGSLRGTVFKGGWCDVGQPESLPLAEAMVRS